jgi:hypothetical protein
MEMKDPASKFSRHQEQRLLRIAKQVARSGFDNPQRIGCPGTHALHLLARRSSSAAESPDLIDHIATCSPCFIEYSRSRTAYKRRSALWSSLASAALLLLCFLFVRARILPAGHGSVSKQEVARESEPLQRVLDLRFSGIPRGDAPASETRQVPRLPRRKLSLSIYLPTGSESGIYEIALVNASGRAVFASSAEAKLENYIEVLPTVVDLSRTAAGQYELRIRRSHAAQWNSYSVVVE